MINSSMFRKILLGFSIIFFVACDTDFNEVGSNIIEDDIHHDNITHEYREVIAYDRATGAVQANNLPINSLGVYNNPVFGKTIAHVVTQVKLNTLNPTFTTNVLIDSVYLYVPYISRAVSANSDGTTTYELDSIYGNTDVAMKLNVYENKFFLRDSDAGESFITGQKYFSDDKPLIDAARNPLRLNNSGNAAENDQFKISAAQVERKAPVSTNNNTLEVKERFAPGIFANLDKEFFQQKILNSQSKLINQNVFKEWFRGLYFNIEDINGNGAMATMDFSKGKIIIIYHQDVAGTEDDDTPERERKVLEINMAKTSAVPINTVNLFENFYSTDYSNALATETSPQGDRKLFLKGGEGSLAFIDLTNAGLLELREDENLGRPKILINEANLTFYVSKEQDEDMYNVSSDDQPLRIYLYDIDSKRPLFDYYTDASTNSANPKRNKSVHGGIIERDANGKGVRYKIRITNYINNIVNHDSLPKRLGLAVTESINVVGNAALRNPVNTTGGGTTSILPMYSVISPLGTVLYGSDPTLPEDKRLRLEIFYTKPN